MARRPLTDEAIQEALTEQWQSCLQKPSRISYVAIAEGWWQLKNG